MEQGCALNMGYAWGRGEHSTCDVHRTGVCIGQGCTWDKNFHCTWGAHGPQGVHCTLGVFGTGVCIAHGVCMVQGCALHMGCVWYRVVNCICAWLTGC